MPDDIVARLREITLNPSMREDLRAVHGLAAELRDIAHDSKHRDGMVKFSGTRWLTYYHSLDRTLMVHDRRVDEIFKAADEIELLREALRIEREECAACAIDRKETQRERDDARREVCRGEAMLRLQRNRVHRDSEEVVRMAKEIFVERGWQWFTKEEER